LEFDLLKFDLEVLKMRFVLTRLTICIEGNIETFWHKKFYPGKEMSNELVWLFVALIIPYAKPKRGIIFSSAAYLNG
jgi:hypothetical protein